MTTTAKYRRVLAAVDFSPHSHAVVHRAAQLAKAAHCPLLLLHVMADPIGAMRKVPYEIRHEFFAGDYQRFWRDLRKESEDQLAALAAEVGKMGVPIQHETILGAPFAEIVHMAQQDECDLVVIGRRGFSRLKYFMLGSTAHRVVQHCPGRVWVVQQESKPAIANVLVAVDFSDVSAGAMEQAVWLCEQTPAKLHILHVMEPSPTLIQLSRARSGQIINSACRRKARNAQLELFQQFIHEHVPAGTDFEQRLAVGEPVKEIQKAAKRVAADVVIMGTVGRSGIKGVLLGNTAEKVLNHVDCDVLAVKPADFLSRIERPFWPLHEPDTAETKEHAAATNGPLI